MALKVGHAAANKGSRIYNETIKFYGVAALQDFLSNTHNKKELRTMNGAVNKDQNFSSQQYINLETFRKNGAGVKTPVWFVQDSGTIYVRTIANSGKIKRIRNFTQVNIAPCKVDGALLGDWHSARAVEINDADIHQKVDRLLGQKYGIMKMLFALSAKLQGKQNTVIKLDVMG